MIKLTVSAFLLALSVFHSNARILHRSRRAPQFLPQRPPIELGQIQLPSGVPNIVGTLFPTTTTTPRPLIPSPGDFGATIGEAAFNFANSLVNPCDNRLIGNLVTNTVQETGQGFIQGVIGGAIASTFGGNPCRG